MVKRSVKGDKENFSIESGTIEKEVQQVLRKHVLQRWYPAAVDLSSGGFFTTLNYKWKPLRDPVKILLLQARHLWTLSKTSENNPDNQLYFDLATQGFLYLKKVLWDQESGGFFESNISTKNEEKLVYNNAFVLFSLSAYYTMSGNEEAKQLADEVFEWIEEKSFDTESGGYFSKIDQFGLPVEDHIPPKSVNTMLHILEAYIEYYSIAKAAKVRERLVMLIDLFMNTFFVKNGYFYQSYDVDLTPFSPIQQDARNLLKPEFVFFGHDVEIVFLLYKSAMVVQSSIDADLIKIGNIVLDHLIRYGWDNNNGGLFNGGLYSISGEGFNLNIKKKSWWVQVELFNTLNFYLQNSIPHERDLESFYMSQWKYIKEYLLDYKYGGFYEVGLDSSPNAKKMNKGHAWKGSYHEVRAFL